MGFTVGRALRSTLLIFESAGLYVMCGRGKSRSPLVSGAIMHQSAKSTTPVSPHLCSDHQQT
ncbi:hypothetical protein BJX96DRAFT_103971 [Aspergillus floccosus]